MGTNEYFATMPTEEVGALLKEKVNKYYEYLNSSGLLDLWKRVYKYYYYGYYSKGLVDKAGKQGEKRRININHFRSLLEHIKVLTTNQRPTFEPRAINNDYKSAAQVILASGLLDYYMRQEGLEDIIDGALEYAISSGEGYIFQEWDDKSGKVIGQADPEEDEDGEVIPGELNHEGNIKSRSFHPVDIIRDWTMENSEDNLWYVVRRFVDKFELAARYPAFGEEIKSMGYMKEIKYQVLVNDFNDDRFIQDSDLIPFYTFRHTKSASVPDGRQVEFLDDGTVVFDGDLPYKDMSIYRIMPAKRRGSAFGYTVAFDMLPIQQAIDMVDSTIITNQNAFGTQIIAAQKGSGVTASTLSEGLTLIQYIGERPPEPLRLLATSPEVYNYKADLIQQMETISGINSVSRGNPEASLKSGAALALVQSMAIQFNTGLQHSYAQLLENLGTGTVDILKEYANAPRVALISGVSKKQYLREFSSKDLDQIDRVIVDMGNPLAKTLSGRMTIADTLMERGAIKSAEEYLQLVTIGRLDPLIEGDLAEQLLIRSENEKLSNGEQVEVVATENHALHIKEHKNVLASPEAKQDKGIVEYVLAHIMQHIQLLRTVDPELLMLLGQQPLTQGIPPVPQKGENTPQQGQVGGQEMKQEPLPPGNEGPNLPSLPSMPNNPLTNQNFNTDTGGL